MSDLNTLFENNQQWADKIKSEDPTFFERLSAQQSPEYLWIGCSDSRVPANQIVGMLPGELFVHRNIANTVVHTDLNCLSVMHYAVRVLKVKHIIVCGHYGCGGVQAALSNQQYGLVDHWLRNIRDVYYNNRDAFSEGMSEQEKLNKMCEMNVVAQVSNVSHTTIVQDAWRDGQELTIHGWIYSLHDGLLKNIAPPIDGLTQVPKQYQTMEL